MVLRQGWVLGHPLVIYLSLFPILCMFILEHVALCKGHGSTSIFGFWTHVFLHTWLFSWKTLLHCDSWNPIILLLNLLLPLCIIIPCIFGYFIFMILCSGLWKSKFLLALWQLEDWVVWVSLLGLSHASYAGRGVTLKESITNRIPSLMPTSLMDLYFSKFILITNFSCNIKLHRICIIKN